MEVTEVNAMYHNWILHAPLGAASELFRVKEQFCYSLFRQKRDYVLREVHDEGLHISEKEVTKHY